MFPPSHSGWGEMASRTPLQFFDAYGVSKFQNMGSRGHFPLSLVTWGKQVIHSLNGLSHTQKGKMNWTNSYFLILSPFYSLWFLIPSQYFSTVSRHFSTIFNYCECIFPWNYFSVKKNPIFFTETSECIFSVKLFLCFFTELELVQVSGTFRVQPWSSHYLLKRLKFWESYIPYARNWTRIAGFKVSYACNSNIKGWL